MIGGTILTREPSPSRLHPLSAMLIGNVNRDRVYRAYASKLICIHRPEYTTAAEPGYGVEAMPQGGARTAAVERFLFHAMNYSRWRLISILDSAPDDRPLSTDVARSIALWLGRSDFFRDRIAAAHYPIASLIAGKHTSNGFRDELAGELRFALLYAIDRFDVGRGYRFTTFATTTLNNRAINALQTAARPVLNMDRLSVEPAAISQAIEPDELNRLRDVLDRNAADLTDDEFAVVDRYFGINRDAETLESLGRLLGCSRSRIVRIRDTAIKKLRCAIALPV